ncbi:MAG: N-acetylmuramoyl-L-alanine amidase [Terriglobales bacterium]
MHFVAHRPRAWVIAAALAAVGAASALYAQQADTPADALSQAHALHQQLLATPAAQRRPADYDRIVALLAPLWQEPTAADADSARYQAAAVYVAEARDLSQPQAYRAAAQLLLALLHQTPYSAFRRNAEFALAQIQRFHLHESGAAAVWLRDFDRRYPADPRVAAAHDELRGVRLPEPDYFPAPEPAASLPQPERGATPPEQVQPPPGTAAGVQPSPSSPPAPSAPPRSPAPDAGGSRQLPVRIGNVNAIAVFSNATSTSIVIQLAREASFSRGELPRRHLAYFDISSRGAARAGGEKRLRIADGRLQEIRVADNRPGFTRIVINLAAGIHCDRGRFFPNPPRLVIGLSGASSSATGHGAAPLPAADPLSTGAESLTRALGLNLQTVVLDAGHGGHDTGTVAADGKLLEKSLVLDVTLRLGRLLRQRLGLNVVYTRRDDTFIPLQERTEIANRAHADLFVSVHANASADPAARGVEAYYLNLSSDHNALALAARENAGSGYSLHQLGALMSKIAAQNKMQESRELAADLDHRLARATGEPDRGVKSAPFVVLIGARMPSVLAEISFLSNPADDRKLARAAYREQLAEALYAGIASYARSLGGMRSAGLKLPVK